MAVLDKLVASFRSKGMVERGDWLATVLGRLGSSPDAGELLVRIENVWAEEAPSLPPGIDRNRPDPGLLKAMGYHVGWTNGQPDATRATIILFLLMADHLPPVKDEIYMAEWGTAWSRTRFEKITRTLSRFIEEAANDPRMGRAVAEWQADIAVAEWAWKNHHAGR